MKISIIYQNIQPAQAFDPNPYFFKETFFCKNTHILILMAHLPILGLSQSIRILYIPMLCEHLGAICCANHSMGGHQVSASHFFTVSQASMRDERCESGGRSPIDPGEQVEWGDFTRRMCGRSPIYPEKQEELGDCSRRVRAP